MFYCSIREWLTVLLEYFYLYGNLVTSTLSQFSSHTKVYLGVVFDTTFYVMNVSKSMAYSIKESANTRCLWSLSDWGPMLHQDSLCRITRLHNTAVQIICGLTKSWLLLVQYQSLCAVLD